MRLMSCVRCFQQILALMAYVICTVKKSVKVCLTDFFDSGGVLCHRFILSMSDVLHFPLGFYTHMQINAWFAVWPVCADFPLGFYSGLSA